MTGAAEESEWGLREACGKGWGEPWRSCSRLREAVSPVAAFDYHEMVLKASAQCLPMAVVWVRRP